MYEGVEGTFHALTSEIEEAIEQFYAPAALLTREGIPVLIGQEAG
jgi:hypothetical protein